MRAIPAQYELVAPGSLDAVLRLMTAEPGAWTPIAGGTELMVQFGAGRLQARKLVSIFGLSELRAIQTSEAWLTIGAGCTYTDIRNHVLITAEFPLLAKAAAWTGSIANQNRGTLGGNIVNGSPAADSPPALLSYGAELELISAREVRRLPYASFHIGYKTTVLAPDELVLAIHLPRGFQSHFHYSRKVGPRNAQAISKIAIAGVGLLRDGKVADIRIGLASMLHAPMRCLSTEAALVGRTLDDEVIQAARGALAAEVAPLDDIRSTAKYRAHVAGNLLEEFLHGLRVSERSQ